MKKIFNLPSALIVGAVMLVFFVLTSCEDSNLRDDIREVTFKATADATLINEGETITYTDSSLTVASRVWSFVGGDITTSTEKIQDVTYDTASEEIVDGETVNNGYLTSLEVEHTDGSIQQNKFNVYVYPRVVADFEADKDTLVFGGTVQFTNLSTAVVSHWPDSRLKDGYFWEFEGGQPATSIEMNPKVTYTTIGTYSVSLKATRDVPKDEMITVKKNYIEVTDVIALQPEFSASEIVIEAGQAITFTDSSLGDPNVWAWSFPGGAPATSSEQNPEIIYNTEGVYDVTLQITRTVDGATETKTSTAFITVNAPSGPYCTDPSNLVGCGNNDGEKSSLKDWVLVGNDNEDKTANLSVSADQMASGNGSLKYLFDEPGKGAFTNNTLRYQNILVKVEESGSYTFSMDVFGDMLSTSSTDYVFEISMPKAGTNLDGPTKLFFRLAGGKWDNVANTVSLEPGDYYIQVKIWNPGFDVNLKYNLFMDNITVVRN